MNLERVSSNLKSDGSGFFEKNLVFKILGPKWPKMRFFKFYEISMRGIFLIFYVKLQKDEGLKLT